MNVEASGQVVMGGAFWTATALFVIAYVLIITERVHKTVVAIFGASLMIVLGVVTQEEAFHSKELGIDWNVIFLLLSMMVIIKVMKPTGVFEYIAVRSAKLAKGRPFRIMAILSVVTASLSAFLDNVTTVLLIAPVTLLICQALELEVVPFLITEALASNIGGTATLIGDPPNIMIASRAQLDFVSFLVNLGPAILLVLVAYILTLRVIFGRRMQVREELRARVMEMDERAALKDTVLLKKCLLVLVITIAGFTLHGVLGLEPATVALFGAGFLLLLAGVRDPQNVLAEAEWSTLFFFMGLFVIIGGIVNVGLVKWLAMQVLDLTRGRLMATSMVVMWFSAFASAFIDNIPYVATMNPLIVDMARHLWPDLSGVALLHHPDLMPMWWSLALGACLGGNGTAIGASANVIVVGLAEKSGSPITFGRFMLYGMPLMVESVVICTIYIWLRYYVLG